MLTTSSPHNAKNHIRLGEMKSLWKAARGGGKRYRLKDKRRAGIMARPHNTKEMKEEKV
jgi:hypothetical protein